MDLEGVEVWRGMLRLTGHVQGALVDKLVSRNGCGTAQQVQKGGGCEKNRRHCRNVAILRVLLLAVGKTWPGALGHMGTWTGLVTR